MTENTAAKQGAMTLLTAKQGFKMFPLIWTVFLSEKEDECPGPFYSRSLRYRCLFQKRNDATWGHIIYFHMDEEEIKILGINPALKTIYFYGAFNQILEYQIRSFGQIREMTEEERSKFSQQIRGRLNGLPTTDRLPLKPETEEAKMKALYKLRSGYFFRFDPINVYYNAHERNEKNYRGLAGL